MGILGRLLFGNPPPIPDVVRDEFEYLYPEGLTMGTLFIGRPGTGKTSSLARHLVEYFKDYPERGVFVLDWSGSISNTILYLILQEPREVRERLIRRLVYDDMGNPDTVVPLPEFSLEYSSDYEEQVQRVSTNYQKLDMELVEGAPFVGGISFKEVLPQLCRVLTAITDEHRGTWQITEAKKLLVDPGLLSRALKRYGRAVPEAKYFLERVFLRLSNHERELRTYALWVMLGAIETKAVRARIGYDRPGWTPREAINKGLMVLIDGSRLINQRSTQHYLFTQAYSLIMAEINKRQPGDPNDQPVALVMDEVYSLLSIPGMAEEVGMLSPLYRSRKLELYIVLQALSQLALTLRKQIWSIGNIVSFGVANFDEAYEIAQQLFKYEGKTVRLPEKTEYQQPVLETDRGQYLDKANKIQRFTHRECILRRFISERELENQVVYVHQTKEHSNNPLYESIDELKSRLIKSRGVPVREALEIINNRKLAVGKRPFV